MTVRDERVCLLIQRHLHSTACLLYSAALTYSMPPLLSSSYIQHAFFIQQFLHTACLFYVTALTYSMLYPTASIYNIPPFRTYCMPPSLNSSCTQHASFIQQLLCITYYHIRLHLPPCLYIFRHIRTDKQTNVNHGIIVQNENIFTFFVC